MCPRVNFIRIGGVNIGCQVTFNFVQPLVKVGSHGSGRLRFGQSLIRRFQIGLELRQLSRDLLIDFFCYMAYTTAVS